MTMDSSRGAGAQQGLKARGGHSWIRNSPWLVTEGSWGRAHKGWVGCVGLLQPSREGSEGRGGWAGVWRKGKGEDGGCLWG